MLAFGGLEAPTARGETPLASTAAQSLERLAAGIALDATRLEAMTAGGPSNAALSDLSPASQRLVERLKLDLDTPEASLSLRGTAQTLDSLVEKLRSARGSSADEFLVGSGLTEAEQAAVRDISPSGQVNLKDEPAIVGTNATATLSGLEAVALLLFRGDNSEKTLNACTGTLVGPKLLLTAAHCVCMDPVVGQKLTANECKTSLRGMKPSAWRVYFPHEGKFDVTSIQIDSDYDFNAGSGSRRADLALLTLDNAPRSIMPMPVAKLPGGTFRGRLVGFGFFGDEAAVQVAAAEGGQNAATITVDRRAGLRATGLNTFRPVSAGQAATDLVQHVLDTSTSSSVICRGDSGGPLLDLGSGELVGVTSSVNRGCTDGAEGQHVRVDLSPLFDTIQQGAADIPAPSPYEEIFRLDREELTIVPTMDREIEIDGVYKRIRVAANAMQRVGEDGALSMKVRFERPPVGIDGPCDRTGSYAKACAFEPPPGADKLFVQVSDSRCIGLQTCTQTVQLLVTGER